MRNIAKFLLAAACIASAGVHARTVVVGDVDYYGPIVIGPERPVLLYARPVVIEHRHYGEPLYLRVPPGHAKHWAKHCRKYHACDRQVYFVDDRWYHEHYAKHRDKHDKHKAKHKHD